MTIATKPLKGEISFRVSIAGQRARQIEIDWVGTTLRAPDLLLVGILINFSLTIDNDGRPFRTFDMLMQLVELVVSCADDLCSAGSHEQSCKT